MTDQREKIRVAVEYIRKKTTAEYPVGIVLGTGLGGLVKEIDIDFALDYADIPYFPISTVETHHGKLIFGTLAGKKVVAMQGRFHFYEGYSMTQIVFPIRVMKQLGVQTLGITNACGGLNPGFKKGDIMLIDDHINMLGGNPLIGPNDPEIGHRFPDMCAPYSMRVLDIAEKVALENGIKVQRGVYVALPGPCLETRAEYRMLRAIGADVVGMSTVPEVIAAVHQGTEVFGMSIITDECFPDCLKSVSIAEIIEVSNQAEPNMTKIFRNVVANL
ncbi:MAG: purine-nucleoside phosphorylase [Chlorobiaceae bacterium]|nr:purine-nucleoside phosphorylase [Chlorobiaceae bacterium]